MTYTWIVTRINDRHFNYTTDSGKADSLAAAQEAALAVVTTWRETMKEWSRIDGPVHATVLSEGEPCWGEMFGDWGVWPKPAPKN